VVVGGCQIWAVSRLGKKNPPHFCQCLVCSHACVRPGIVVKEKDVFHVSVRTNCTEAFSQFVLNLLSALVLCSEVEAGNFATLLYSVLLNIGKSMLKMTKNLCKNILTILIDVRIAHANFILIALYFLRENWRHYFRTAPPTLCKNIS
jgi:hypothetical protein